MKTFEAPTNPILKIQNAKIFLILYPWFENSTTGIAITLYYHDFGCEVSILSIQNQNEFCLQLTRFNPVWHNVWKQEKCSSLEPPRDNFYKTQWAGQGVKITWFMSIFTSKKVWKFLKKISGQNLIQKGQGNKCISSRAKFGYFFEMEVTQVAQFRLSRLFCCVKNWLGFLKIIFLYKDLIGRTIFGANIFWYSSFFEPLIFCKNGPTFCQHGIRSFKKKHIIFL